MCYSIAPSARILIYMISRTGWQIAPSRLTCGVGGASALRLRALQPVTAPTPRTRAARHGRSERRRRPIAAVAREAVRDPQNRRNSSHVTAAPAAGAAWCYLEANFHRPRSNDETRVFSSTAAHPSGLLRVGTTAKRRPKPRLQGAKRIGATLLKASRLTICESDHGGSDTFTRVHACPLHAPRDAMPVPCALPRRC